MSQFSALWEVATSHQYSLAQVNLLPHSPKSWKSIWKGTVMCFNSKLTYWQVVIHIFSIPSQCIVFLFSVPISVVCSIIIGWVWIHLLEVPGPEITTDYGRCVTLIAISTVIEKLSEPLYVTSQAFHFVRLRVRRNA